MIGDTSRRFSAGVRPDEGNPRLPQRYNPECSNPRRAVAGASETWSQGLELVMARFDKLESRFEEIDRRWTKLQASRAAYRPPPRRRPTCWDPPFRTQSHRVEEIRAPPLPEPPPQYTPLPFQQPTLVHTRMPTCWDTPDQRQSRGSATHEQPYGVPPYEQTSPTPRQYSCWDPSRQHTTEAADSQHVLYSVEAAVSGGKRITGPGIRPYLTSYGETGVNKEVNHKRLPITCSKIDHADDNDVRATTKEPVDEVGRTLFFGKTLGAEPKAIGSLDLNLAPEDQVKELPDLPRARLKIEDEPFNEEENYDHSAVPQQPSLTAAISCSMTRIVVRIGFAVGSVLLRKSSKDSLYVDERKFTCDLGVDDNGSALARIQRSCTFTFDPGGYKSPKLFFQLFVALWFHLEDKVDFNRGGVVTSLLLLFSLDIVGICISSFLILFSWSLS